MPPRASIKASAGKRRVYYWEWKRRLLPVVGSGAPFFTQLWLQFIIHSQHTASESRTSRETKKRIIWPHLNFMALTDDKETKRGGSKGRRLNR